MEKKLSAYQKLKKRNEELDNHNATLFSHIRILMEGKKLAWHDEVRYKNIFDFEDMIWVGSTTAYQESQKD